MGSAVLRVFDCGRNTYCGGFAPYKRTTLKLIYIKFTDFVGKIVFMSNWLC